MQLLIPAKFVVVGDIIACLGKWCTVTSYDWTGRSVHLLLDGTTPMTGDQDEIVRVLSSALD